MRGTLQFLWIAVALAVAWLVTGDFLAGVGLEGEPLRLYAFVSLVGVVFAGCVIGYRRAETDAP